MEHIVHFGINIDDEAVKNAVVNNATREIEKRVGKDIEKAFFQTDYRGESYDVTVRGKEIIKEWFNEHSEEIIDRTTRMLADSLQRTKRVREAVKRITEEINEQ